MKNIIGIGGKLASGKDAISDHLVAEHGWTKLGMSDALGEALLALDPYIPIPLGDEGLPRFIGRRFTAQKFERYSELFERVGYTEAKVNDEVRRLLQKLGTEVGRKIIDEHTWTNIVIRRAEDALAEGAPGVIITGIRYPNELDMIEDLDGELWWVDRPSLAATVNAGHSSENSVSSVDFDRVILNDGTLEDLYKKVDDLVTT